MLGKLDNQRFMQYFLLSFSVFVLLGQVGVGGVWVLLYLEIEYLLSNTL